MYAFTIIGFYRATGQRYSGSFIGKDADAAEAEAKASVPGLAVCGVIEGSHNTRETSSNIDE